jgi:nicotinamidase-related amidase
MSTTAVLVIDMINDYRHADAEKLAESVGTIVGPLRQLITEAGEREDVDLIYVNDNRGDFTADFRVLAENALAGQRPDLVEPVLPAPGCAIVTKVRHSVFYATALDYLLARLETRRLVLTGQVTEQCILYSALDSYVRHYDVVVPPDAVAHIDPYLGKAALAMMERNMRAELLPTDRCLSGCGS